MQYANETLGIYMYSAVYNDLTYKTLGTVLSSPFMVLAMVGVPFLCKKFGLEVIIRYSLLIGGAIFAALFGAHLIMDVPPLLHGIISGIAAGMAMVSIQMQWGLVGESIDYNEVATGKRMEGTIYGTFNLARRIGQTIGMGFSLYALGWVGYVGTQEVQTSGTILGLKIICVLVPALFVLGAWAAFKFIWKITPDMKDKLVELKVNSTPTEKDVKIEETLSDEDKEKSDGKEEMHDENSDETN
jgi:GPH family glycoside/pentoside/hexuronide:cation symporter